MVYGTYTYEVKSCSVVNIGNEPMTLKEIGEKIGLTRERVRQIEHDSLKKLRDSMK